MLFKQVVDLINKKEHLTSEGLNKIVSIKASMNNGLSKSLREYFPEVTPVVRPLVEDQEIKDPNWFTGFTSGEGCFDIKITKSTSEIGYNVGLRFRISQHSRDLRLMENFVNYLGCGRIEKRSKHSFLEFIVLKYADIEEKIIPFFHKYPIQGIKSLDFQL